MPTNDFRNFNPDGSEQPSAPGGPPPGDELPGWTREVTLEDVRRIYVKHGYERFAATFAGCDTAGGLVPSFVFAPFFISYAWFFYRKMYLEGLILMGASFLLMFIGGGVVQASPESGGAIVLGVNLVFLLGMMVYGKALYWRAVDRKIARAMQAFPDNPQKAMAWLDSVGGTNIWIVLAFFGLVFFIAFSLAASLPGLEQQGGM